MRLRPDPRDERGAVAILVALCASVLFAVSALAVDLGDAYQRKGEVQSQADMAALAAGASLPTQTAVLAAVCKSASLNEKTGENLASCVAGASTATTADPACPTDTGAKPYVYFFADNPYKAKVCSPPAHVDYGLAQTIPGVGEGIDVRGSATVIAGSAGVSSEMPFYGYQGCDWGSQTLTDPANGHVAASGDVPEDLAQPTPGSWTWQSLSFSTTQALDPAQIALPTASATVRISGQGLSKATRVGFYRETGLVPSKVEPNALPSNGDSTGKFVDFAVPADVLANPGVWYVRVYATGNNSSQTGWSTDALPLAVGDSELIESCAGKSASGNFGALRLPRTDVSSVNDQLAKNISDGLQAPLSLSAGSGSGTCADGQTGVVFSSGSTLKPRTNCVATDPGLPANATTQGLLGTGGRLTKAPTTTGILGGRNCGPGHSSSTWTTPTGASANDDTLTCFMTSPSMSLGTIATASYSGPSVLDPSIYRSPRFCQVPIVSQKPTNGTSQDYWIVDVRPCFITGESLSSTYSNQLFNDGPDGHNGVRFGSNHRVSELHVVLFNRKALPNSGANIGDYLGTGPVAVQLVQ